MKRLTKLQETTRSELVDALRGKAAKVQEALAEVNQAIVDKLNVAIQEYNDKLTEADSFRDEITAAMSDYMDERSDKWREGDAASEHESWMGEWEGLDTDHIDEASEIDEPDMAHADEMENLQNEVSQ